MTTTRRLYSSMTPAERNEVRAARKRVQAERDRLAMEHSKANPLTTEDIAVAKRMNEWLAAVASKQ